MRGAETYDKTMLEVGRKERVRGGAEKSKKEKRDDARLTHDPLDPSRPARSTPFLPSWRAVGK